MMNKLILTIALVLVSASYAEAQCCGGGGCSTSGSCGSGGCGISYRIAPPVYYAPPVHKIYYDDTALRIQIKNIPGGYERTRYYVDVYFEDEKVTAKVPVINGVLPDASVYKNEYGRFSDLVLDYSGNRKYSNVYAGHADGYIHYNSSRSKPTAVQNFERSDTAEKVKQRTENLPSAVKPDGVPFKVLERKFEDNLPKRSVHRPDDSDVDNILQKKVILQERSTLPSDSEIDNLLRRPSSIQDGGSSFIDYNR